MQRLWPDTFVEEISLTKNISVLRKALSNGNDGREIIETIPKRGYRFLGPVTDVSGSGEVPATPPSLGPGPDQASTATLEHETSREAAHRPEGRSRVVRRWVWALGVLVASLALATLWLTVGRSAFSFGQRDWILIADFENQTGDPRFDKALLTALTVSL